MIIKSDLNTLSYIQNVVFKLGLLLRIIDCDRLVIGLDGKR